MVRDRVTPASQPPRHLHQPGDVLGFVPAVELALVVSRHVKGDEEHVLPGSDGPVSPISTPTKVSAADAVANRPTASRLSADALLK